MLEDENIEMVTKKGYQKIFVPIRGNKSALRKMGVSFEILNELEALGVIKISTINGYVTTDINTAKGLLCIGDKLGVISRHTKGKIPVGNVLLTSVGEALQRITVCEEIHDYFEMVTKYVRMKHVKFAVKHDFQVTVEADTLHISKKIS